jgi:hypothetical protein
MKIGEQMHKLSNIYSKREKILYAHTPAFLICAVIGNLDLAIMLYKFDGNHLRILLYMLRFGSYIFKTDYNENFTEFFMHLQLQISLLKVIYNWLLDTLYTLLHYNNDNNDDNDDDDSISLQSISLSIRDQ